MPKVLLVEDDNNLREIYEARLQAEGYEISSAQDGEQALVVAKEFQPDLIISDVMMPKISGFEMLDILRNTEGLKHTRVIMLTALGQAEDKTRADSLGADRYLVKSQVTLEDIIKAAHQLLDDPSTLAAPAASTLQEVTPTTVPVTAAPIMQPEPAPVSTEPVASVAQATEQAFTPAPDLAVASAPEAVDPTPVVPLEPPSTASQPQQAAQTVNSDTLASQPLVDNAIGGMPPSDQISTASEPVSEVASPAINPAYSAAAPVDQGQPDAVNSAQVADPQVAISEDGVMSSQPGSVAAEQATVNAQIENFINSQPTTTPNDDAVAPQLPDQPQPSNDAATADDALMAEALDDLSESAPSAQVIKPTDAQPAPEEAASAPATYHRPENDNDIVSINNKKVIQPLPSEDKPHINDLLAQEEAREAAGNIMQQTPVVDGTMAQPTQEALATPHQPGEAITPQAPTEQPTFDTNQPQQPLKKPNDFDPNNISL